MDHYYPKLWLHYLHFHETHVQGRILSLHECLHAGDCQLMGYLQFAMLGLQLLRFFFQRALENIFPSVQHLYESGCPAAEPLKK